MKKSANNHTRPTHKSAAPSSLCFYDRLMCGVRPKKEYTMKRVALAVFIAVLFCAPALTKAAECIPVYRHSLSPSHNNDRSLNDAFYQTLTTMLPLYLYLDLEVTEEQARDIEEGVDDQNRIYFFVKGNEWDAEYLLHLPKGQTDFGYSAKDRKLRGFFVVDEVVGPNTGIMSVNLKPFSPTLKKCH